jgi:hypothetical protein
VALVLLTVTFSLVIFMMVRSGILVDPAQVVAALASFFAIVGTLVGAYFGIKSSREAASEIDKVADASGDYADRLAQAKPDDILTIAGTQTEILTGYYTAVLAQANQSFRWALVAALVGLAFFFGAVAFVLTRQDQSAATVSVIGGALVEVISGVMFYLYGRTTAQLADYQQRLAQTLSASYSPTLSANPSAARKNRKPVPRSFTRSRIRTLQCSRVATAMPRRRSNVAGEGSGP